MIANLPMYHRSELVEAHNEFWQLIRGNLAKVDIDTPEKLSQDAGEMEVWVRPDLIFSQTCSMPYRTLIYEQVTLIGTPDYGLAECPNGYYRSAFIVHKDEECRELIDYKNAKFAFNMEISQSGFVAAKAEAAKHGFFFKKRVCSGGHLNSARMVADKKADIAAIDALSLKLMERNDDFFERLKVIQWTEPTPTLPYISGPNADADLYFECVKSAISQLSTDARKKLMIKDLIKIPTDTYLALD